MSLTALPALPFLKPAAFPVAPGVVQAAAPHCMRPRGRRYLEQFTCFTILGFLKCSSQRFKLLYIPLPVALPHLKTPKARKDGGRARAHGCQQLIGCLWFAKELLEIMKSEHVLPLGGARPAVSPNKTLSSPPHRKPQRDREFGVHCRHAGRDGHMCLRLLQVCSEQLRAGLSSQPAAATQVATPARGCLGAGGMWTAKPSALNQSLKLHGQTLEPRTAH